MDVTVAPIPPSYDQFRARLAEVIATHRPGLRWKPRTGLRVPEDRETVEQLRRWVRALHDAGFVLERFSERPVDPFEQRILADELGRTGIPFVLGNPLVSGALKQFGTQEQRRIFLDGMANGTHIWTQLFSEPNAGSDLTALATRARRDGDHYVVDGQKVWSTWAQWADFGYLLARTGPEPGSAGISAFVLDMRLPGIEVRPLREMTGTADFNEVFLSGVRVPASDMLGEPGQGWLVAQASLAAERGGVGADGSSELIEDLVELARRSRRHGQPSISDAAVRQDLAALAARARIHTYLGYSAATRAQRGEHLASDAPLRKVWFSELNLDVVEYGLSLQSARSILAEGDPRVDDDGRWQDMFLYARAWTIAGGSNEIMRNLIAERGLGLPREPRPAS